MGPKRGHRHQEESEEEPSYEQQSAPSSGHGGGRRGKHHDVDFTGAEDHAAEQAGDSGDRSMFSSALGFLHGNKDEIMNQDIDENAAVQSHQTFFGSGGSAPADSGSMGGAAAMQALKMFSGGESSSSTSSSGGGMGMLGGLLGGGTSGSSSSQNAFVGMAMAQASKLYDSQNASGNVTSGTDKQSVVNEAAKQAAMMYMKSQMGMGGSSSSGSSSGIMSLASKFM